jgi:hypothetical protein
MVRALVRVELHRILGEHGDFGELDFEAGGIEGFLDGFEFVGGCLDFDGALLDGDVVGAGLESDGHKLVLVDACGVHSDESLAVEHPGDASGLAEVAVVAGEHVSDLGGRPVFIIGQRLHEDGDAAGTVAFVHDLLRLRHAFQFAGALLDGALDVVGRHVAGLALGQDRAQGDVGAGIAAADARRDRQFLGQLAEDLAALGVGGALLMLDGRPLAMSAHTLPCPFRRCGDAPFDGDAIPLPRPACSSASATTSAPRWPARSS